MNSPITGKEMILIEEPKTLLFKGKNYDIVFHCYKCEDSGETFTTTELDEININQVYEQYKKV